MEFLLLIALIIMGGPIFKAIARRIGDGSVPDDRRSAALQRAISENEGRMEETEQRVEDLIVRLAEVEERLDFTERLLTQERERNQLPNQ